MASLKERLGETANKRAAIEARFGFVPMSVIRQINRGALSKQMYIYQREVTGRIVGDAGDYELQSEEGKAAAEERKRLGLIGGVLTTNKGGKGKRMGASIMPAELVDFFVKYYAEPGDTYVDPFMGQGIQMQVANLRGLHYYGYDLSTEFFAYIDAVRPKLKGPGRISITHGDSRFPTAVPDGIGDFSFHSPPYWDIEYYGDEPEQLGSRSYEAFLEGMRDVYTAWLPKFKPGAYHVINVNDFRRDGKFYAYHADTMRILEESGWMLHDMWIVEGLIGGLSKVFAVDKNSRRTAPKVHEYCIVCRAP